MYRILGVVIFATATTLLAYPASAQLSIGGLVSADIGQTDSGGLGVSASVGGGSVATADATIGGGSVATADATIGPNGSVATADVDVGGLNSASGIVTLGALGNTTLSVTLGSDDDTDGTGGGTGTGTNNSDAAVILAALSPEELMRLRRKCVDILARPNRYSDMQVEICRMAR